MTTPTKPTARALRVEDELARFAISFPEVVEENPWGHRAFKVRGKTFVFLGADADIVSLSLKLPESGSLALSFEFAEPTGYGLGKSGWVTARFASASTPVSMIREWLDESYRAIAPKKLGATVGREPAPAKKASAKKVPAKKAPAKKPR